MNSKRLQRDSGSLCLKYILIVTNCVFVILAGAVIGVVVYLCIDQIGFIKGVLGTDLVVASAGLIIAAGCLLFIFSIFGLIAAALEHTTLLAIYFTFMIILFCTFICGAICVAVYKTQLSDQVRLEMENNLRKYYGVNLDNKWNKQVTDSWDQAQSTWRCCSVGDQSWAIYRQSEWYKIQPGVPGTKPYVPSSCCVKDENGQISDANLKECQTKQDGPPGTDLGSQYAGNVNTALFYRGCYEAAKDYMQNNQLSWYTVMIGIGIGLAILMLIGLALSIGLFCSLKQGRKRDRERSTIMMSTSYQQNNSKHDPSYYMYSVA